MLVRNLLIFGLSAAAMSQIPAVMGWTEQTTASSPSPTLSEVQPSTIPAKQSAASGTSVIASDRTGHFRATFRINGKPVEGLVDTGASVIALNESTARRLGFGGNALEFRYDVETANGKTKAAKVTLDRVELDDVRVRDVSAMVLRDEALSSSLIGMSFLKKLASYSVQDGTLRLKQ